MSAKREGGRGNNFAFVRQLLRGHVGNVLTLLDMAMVLRVCSNLGARPAVAVVMSVSIRVRFIVCCVVVWLVGWLVVEIAWSVVFLLFGLGLSCLIAPYLFG